MTTEAEKCAGVMAYFAAQWAACMETDDFESAADYVTKIKGLVNFAAVITAHTRERKNR